MVRAEEAGTLSFDPESDTDKSPVPSGKDSAGGSSFPNRRSQPLKTAQAANKTAQAIKNGTLKRAPVLFFILCLPIP
jgi:hypothetical protein